MITKTIAVTSYVKVRMDETKFTPEWMAEFHDDFYPFLSLDAHARHLAELCARGIMPENYLYDQCGVSPHPFVEGYGPLSGMGITLQVKDVETEIQE